MRENGIVLDINLFQSDNCSKKERHVSGGCEVVIVDEANGDVKMLCIHTLFCLLNPYASENRATIPAEIDEMALQHVIFSHEISNIRLRQIAGGDDFCSITFTATSASWNHKRLKDSLNKALVPF